MGVPLTALRRALLHRLLSLGLAAGLATGLLAAPGPAVPDAAASCAAVPSIEDALLRGDVVVVGSVVGLENEDRWATVRVEERWRGARDLPDTIIVHGGPEPGGSTTVDRTYRMTRYLFVLTRADGYFADDACTATRPWSADLAAYRPAGVSPAPDVVSGAQITAIDPSAVAIVAGLLLALLVAIVAYIVILRARNRPPDWVR